MCRLKLQLQPLTPQVYCKMLWRTASTTLNMSILVYSEVKKNKNKVTILYPKSLQTLYAFNERN